MGAMLLITGMHSSHLFSSLCGFQTVSTVASQYNDMPRELKFWVFLESDHNLGYIRIWVLRPFTFQLLQRVN